MKTLRGFCKTFLPWTEDERLDLENQAYRLADDPRYPVEIALDRLAKKFPHRTRMAIQQKLMEIRKNLEWSGFNHIERNCHDQHHRGRPEGSEKTCR